MNNQRWLSQNFFTFFFTWGVYLPYWTGWLVNDKGLTVADASMVMSLGLVTRAVSTMFVFPLVSRKLSNKKVLIVFTAISLLCALAYIPTASFVGLFIVTMLFSAVYPALLPAMENSATMLMSKGTIHYGKARSFGSFGFVVAVLILSMLTGNFGEAAILWSMIAGLITMLIIQLLPAPEVLSETPMKQTKDQSFSMKALWEIKGFPIVMLIVILLQGAHASYYNYGYIYLQDLQVNPFYIGMIINVAVIFEIIYFLKADTFLSEWKPSSLLLLSAIGATVRWILIFLFPNVWVFIASQALHALSFGVAHFAFIKYISQELPKEQMANAQGVYSALGMSLSAAILTLLGGALYEIEPGLAFLGMLICTIPAIFIIYFTRKQYKY